MLVGMGASSLIALKLGAGKRGEAEAVVGTAMTMALALSMSFTLIVAVLMRPILVFFGGTGVILDYAMQFTTGSICRACSCRSCPSASTT